MQVCRYLSEKLVEAWENAEQGLPGKPQITPEGLPSTGALDETLLPRDPDERLAIAMRLVSERCIYGVDKNPLAVEMAKLSLWLITLNKNRPFTFLDHALRCGDLLLGVNLQQLTTWSMDNIQETSKPRQMVWFELAITHALNTALKLRRQISNMQELDVHDIEAKSHLLTEAEEAMELVKLGADLLIATSLSDIKRRELLEGTIHVRYTVLVGAFEDARREKFTEAHQEKLRQDFKVMREEVDELLKGRRPFHWPLEFPEVFAVGMEEERGFAAIISNPPFMGGKFITGAVGSDYRNYLVEYVANRKRGSTDICSYFFLRATKLIEFGGMCGLIATSTIAQGDVREVGLDQILASGWTIPMAIPCQKWPGEASLEIACVWLRRGKWNGSYILEDNFVAGITSSLTPLGKFQGKLYKLIENANKSFQGSIVLGMGFVLDKSQAAEYIAMNKENKEVLFPFLSGEDINNQPDQTPSRWVINFHDWPLERAELYPECIKIVRDKVKPKRDIDKRKVRRERWWQYAERAAGLYNRITGMRRVLAIAFTTKYVVFAWEPTDIIFSLLTVITLDSDASFALLQCTFHQDWAIANGSTLGSGPRYTPTDCFETFPFPANMEGLDDIGECYYQHRQVIMLARQEGLTKTYNRFHDQKETAEDIAWLRELHREMDEAVARTYGWDDLDLGHGFHETKQGLRYTISEEARREVLGRLLKLNYERYAEEVALGLHEKGAKAKKKGKRVIEEKARYGVGQRELVFE